MRLLLALFLTPFLLAQFAEAQAVVVEEGRRSGHEEVKQGSYLKESRQISDVLGGGHYSSVQELRSDRRVGIGVEAFGRLGLMGVNFELNLAPMQSALIGLGGGPGYSSVSIGGKHVFFGERAAPYLCFSFAHWSGNSKSTIDGTTPGYLEDRFLSKNEKASGQFAKTFMVPAFGLQLNELVGRSAGGVVYAEVVLMIEPSTMDYIPNGALGASYFF